MRKAENIGHIVRDKGAISYRDHEKYLLSVTVIRHLSFIKGKKQKNKFLSPSNH